MLTYVFTNCNSQTMSSSVRFNTGTPEEIGSNDQEMQDTSMEKQTEQTGDVSVKKNVVVEEAPDSTSPSALPGYLPWEGDMEMVSKYLDRKDELEESHKTYLLHNPELKALLADFIQAVIIQKPANVVKFAGEYFRPFARGASHQPPYPSHTVQNNNQ